MQKIVSQFPKTDQWTSHQTQVCASLRGTPQSKDQKGNLKLTVVTQLSMHILSFAVEKGKTLAVHRWPSALAHPTLCHSWHIHSLLCDTEKALHLRCTAEGSSQHKHEINL